MFQVLCHCGMKLNPKKYVFGVWSVKLLGFMISSQGIEANPEQGASHPQYETTIECEGSQVLDWLYYHPTPFHV